jgi:hypothetical protein
MLAFERFLFSARLFLAISPEKLEVLMKQAIW